MTNSQHTNHFFLDGEETCRTVNAETYFIRLAVKKEVVFVFQKG